MKFKFFVKFTIDTDGITAMYYIIMIPFFIVSLYVVIKLIIIILKKYLISFTI